MLSHCLNSSVHRLRQLLGVLSEVILSFTGELLLILVLLKLFCATELSEPALDSFRSVFEFLGSPLRSEVFLLLLKASFRLICNFQCSTVKHPAFPLSRLTSGDYEIRTHDPLLAGQVLSQLS